MEELAKVLEVLAMKLGTTTQYLWEVLIRQALITGITDIIQYLILIACVPLWLKHMKKSRQESKEADDITGFCIAMIIVGVVLAILLIVAFFSFPNTVSAFLNPEYWALDKIISKIGTK